MDIVHLNNGNQFPPLVNWIEGGIKKTKMKLTKIQRYTVYCILLAEVEHERRQGILYGCGFCWIIADVFFDSYSQLFKSLKELQMKKPLIVGLYWFDNFENGWRKRIKLLKCCIEETHP